MRQVLLLLAYSKLPNGRGKKRGGGELGDLLILLAHVPIEKTIGI